MARTSEKCQQSGIYQSACADRIQIALSRGDTFPPCRNHGAVGWILLQATSN
ncbi:MAG: YjzC family protein [Actinobacteria bacterium]|nr:YjzC family protein [Actinomycetota bacterium]